MTSMTDRRKEAQERIAELLEQAPAGVDKRTWLNDALGLGDDVDDLPEPEAE